MSNPYGFKALDNKTFEDVHDPDILSASRCISLLVACDSTAVKVLSNAGRHPRVAAAEIGDLVAVILRLHEGGLVNDIRTLAKMLRCNLILVDESGKAEA